jgi:hypothetical protein
MPKKDHRATLVLFTLSLVVLGSLIPFVAKLPAALDEDLGGDLIRVVSSWQPDHRLVIAVAEPLHIAEGVTRPTDREQYKRHIAAGNVGLELVDRLMHPGLDPDEFL